jgi:drug/metabolite transporter (DMT)-like permease
MNRSLLSVAVVFIVFGIVMFVQAGQDGGDARETKKIRGQLFMWACANVVAGLGLGLFAIKHKPKGAGLMADTPPEGPPSFG